MIWRSLNAINSTVYSVFREPSKELAEPRLKNTGLAVEYSAQGRGFNPRPMLDGKGVKAMPG